LADLDAQFILSFLDHLENDRKNGARSRNARWAALRSFLKYAAHYDLTALPVIQQALAIPMKRFDKPLQGFLSRPEVQAILEAPDTRTWVGQRDRALFSLMYNTGARVSEVIGLRVGDVVIDGTMAAHLHGKGRKERSVPLWRPTASLIRGWKRRLEGVGDDRFLFPSRSGERMARSNVTQRLKLAGHDAGAQNWAMLASIIETCKLNNVEPHAYLTGVLTAIARGHKQKDIDQLLPWNFRG
jgi:site-specific recombinase XerD